MKFFKVFISFLLCAVILTSCSTVDNSAYFREKISENIVETSEDMFYIPVIFRSIENSENVKVSVMPDTVSFFLADPVEAKSHITYQNVNVHIRTHSENVENSVRALTDSFGEDDKVRIIKTEYKDKPYAVTYDIREDLDIIMINVIYPISDYVSAFFTAQINGIIKIDENSVKKICNDLQMVKI